MSILAEAPVIAERDKESLLLIDSDYFAYMVGAISQSPTRDTDIRDQEYVCIDEDTETMAWVDPLPLVHWRIDNEFDKIKDTLQSDNIEPWLTPDKGNFRTEVAVSRPYKGGRTGRRPYHYQAIRDYMVHTHGAKMAVGCEADDMVCTRQMEMFIKDRGHESIIVGVDKDLFCMFGAHFNPRKEELYILDWQDSATEFYYQMIVGDRTDNIPGCKGRGEAFFDKLNQRCSTIEDLAMGVYDAYMEKGHDDDYFVEQGQLLHMRRFEGEMWHPYYPWEYGYYATIH